MPKLSIVVTYRNRNVERAARFLASLDAQTYRDFELIFVDYGSDPEYAQAVEERTSQYTWCRHVYNDTRGMLWNKSHAINTGVRLTSGAYFLSTDIDLIYTRDVLQHAMQEITPEQQLFCLAYMLPETFTAFDTLEAERPTRFEESAYQSIGMFHLLSNEIFQDRLGGLDEYYCIWGREDTDGYIRGRNAGLESRWIDNRKYPLYHQWHPTFTASHAQYEKWWWEDLVLYFELQRDDVFRAQPDWGRLLKSEERKTLHDNSYTTMDLPTDMNPYQRSRVVADIIDFLKHNPGKVLQINIPQEAQVINYSGPTRLHRLGFRGVRAFNKMCQSLNIKLQMRPTVQGPTSSEDSIMYSLFNLIVKHRLVHEYHYSQNGNKHIYKLCSKET